MTRKDTAEPRHVVLQQQLALVLRNIETSARKIAEQREIVVQLAQAGHDTSKDFNELANFEKEHALNIATHRQITKELTELGQVSPARKHRPGKAGRKARKIYSTHRSSRKK
jgi:hypothetical protein